MDLNVYIDKEAERNELSRDLIIELRKISHDTEFIYGVLLDVENDEDKETLLEYIKNGENVSFSQIILNALWLSEQRKKRGWRKLFHIKRLYDKSELKTGKCLK